MAYSGMVFKYVWFENGDLICIEENYHHALGTSYIKHYSLGNFIKKIPKEYKDVKIHLSNDSSILEYYKELLFKYYRKEKIYKALILFDNE